VWPRCSILLLLVVVQTQLFCMCSAKGPASDRHSRRKELIRQKLFFHTMFADV
jgi:hypothetical protein